MKAKIIYAIIKNDKGEICHKVKDIVRVALAMNLTLKDTKIHLINYYKEYIVEFVVRTN